MVIHKTRLIFSECLNLQYCAKFGQLVLRKIIKVVATRCHILRLKCTKFDFGWGSAPDPAGGSSQCSPDLLTGFEGVLLLMEGKGIGWKGKGKKRKKGGKEGKGEGREGRKGRGEGCVVAFGGMDAPADLNHNMVSMRAGYERF